MANVKPTDSLKALEGKTIDKVHVLGINAVQIVTVDGCRYDLETVHALLGIHAMELTIAKG